MSGVDQGWQIARDSEEIIHPLVLNTDSPTVKNKPKNQTNRKTCQAHQMKQFFLENVFLRRRGCPTPQWAPVDRAPEHPLPTHCAKTGSTASVVLCEDLPKCKQALGPQPGDPSIAECILEVRPRSSGRIQMTVSFMLISLFTGPLTNVQRVLLLVDTEADCTWVWGTLDWWCT